jgi:lipopolysaccharide assembly outer membrane protein LptD (OstA)
MTMLQRASIWISTGAILVTGVGWTLHASARQTPPNPAKPKAQSPQSAGQKPQKTDYEEFEDVVYEVKTGITTGRNFVYKRGEMTITGNKARYDEKNKRLLAEGNLTMDDTQYHGTGDKADVDDGPKKLAIITGNIKIVLKPKKEEKPNPDAKEDVGSSRRRGGTVTCERVESYYKKKFSTLSGNLVFKQTVKNKDGQDVERTLTADHADYDSKVETMTLYPPVNGSDTEGVIIKAVGIVVIGTKEGEETLTSKDKVTIIRPIKEDEDDDGTKPPPNQESKR